MESDDDVDVDVDSLFGSETDQDVDHPIGDAPVASRAAPSIPGLFFFPGLISCETHDRVLHQVSQCGYFALENDAEPAEGDSVLAEAYQRSTRNQAMLFARSLPSLATPSDGSVEYTDEPKTDESHLAGCSGLPLWAIELIQQLQYLLTSQADHHLPPEVKQLLFPTNQLLSRQLILNLYNGAEGLSPHVDLVNRFADGIILCSFGPQGTGTVMDFTHASQPFQHLFLPSGSVLVLSGEARYDWKHGITARQVDLVRAVDNPDRVEALMRSIRLSVTIRSMLPGADVVGE